MLELSGRILRHRGLLATLVARELKARYRGSALGFLWSLVNPLLLLLVYTFVFTQILPGGRVPGFQPFWLALMIGLFPWVWASTSILEGTVSLTTNASLIRKAVFPAEILPIVSVASNLVHFLFAMPILGVALVIGRLLGHPVGGWSALLLPIVIALQLLVVGGFALGLSALNVHFKDVKDIVQNLLTLLFFLTPIIYPLSFVENPILRGLLIWANPVTAPTLAYHDLLLRGQMPDATVWMPLLLWAVVAWVVGGWLFDRLSDSLAEAV
jgi:ABC-type polysaccharide/polyol phosphate export permease